MNTDANEGIGLPSTGAVLGFMVDCLGISKEEPRNGPDGMVYKDLELLRKGGMSPERDGRVMMRVMEAVLATFMESGTAQQTLRAGFNPQFKAPVRRIRWETQKHLVIPVPEFAGPPESVLWRWDSQGRLQNVREHLVHDWTEFLFRHNSLVTDTDGSAPVSDPALMAWALLFVVPFLAANLVEYQRNNSQLERGMPGGRFWHLPAPVKRDGDDFSYKWPVNQVLEWWEDLLGGELYDYSEFLCDLGDDPDGARRQIHAWRYENRPPKPTTIARWCKVNWREKYKGAFQDETAVPLAERWKQCREFLVRKGFNDFSQNWLNAGGEHGEKVLGGQYRGERFEQEILPFRETPFRTFFESPDPIAAGLPVEELIRRVGERFAIPTDDQLRERLLVASAAQRVFTKTAERLGGKRAFCLLGWFQEVYCFLVDIHNQADPETGAEVLRLLRNVPNEQLRLRYACEWLYDETSWRTLPNEISQLARRGISGAK